MASPLGFQQAIQSQLLRRLALVCTVLLLHGCDADKNAGGDSAQSDRAATIRSATANLDGARIAAADSEPGNWLAHGRTYDEQRFSPLTKVNDSNIKQLGLAWYWDTGTTRGLEASPIVVGGVMFTTGSWSMVYANDAKTGELIWQFDPKVPREWGVYACCDVVNRGVAVWKGRVYFGTIDGRLIALDAGSGSKVWEVQTTDKQRPYTITGAPRIVKDKVIIGNGGAEYGVRGYITAYDTASGKQLWRFWTVPGDPSKPFEGEHLKQAASTWRGGEWWKVGGGGTVWDSMSFDPALNLLYIGTGNGSPWNRYIRSPGGGDNLYLSSIVAINPDDGAMKWFYQTTPGDSWDYTAVQHMILADIKVNGAVRKVLMQAPKNGFFYVLDRTNGELLSAAAYAPVTWASRVDLETGRPVENPEAHYANASKLIKPAPYGGHNWHPMSFSPNTGLVYIPVLDIPFMYGQDNAFKYNPRTWNTGIDTANTVPSADPQTAAAGLKEVKGYLAAWDPVTQREVWRAQHSGSWNGGVLSTAGNLVFQGLADGRFTAYNARTGQPLWESTTYTGTIAPPISYEIDGEQYVAVMAGWGGAFSLASGVPRQAGNRTSVGRILAYKLGGKLSLPVPPATPALDPPPPLIADAATVRHGELLFHTNCSVCHGGGAVSSGALPDLRNLKEETHAAWDAIVLKGAFKSRGMVSFAHVLSQRDSNAIHQYVISRAHADRANAAAALPQTHRPPAPATAPAASG